VDSLSLLAIAVALAMDAFAVALAAGAILHPLTFRPCFRLAFHFGLFQALMPVIGWLAGLTVQSFVAAWSHWIAFGLLLFIGGRMIKEALAADDDAERSNDPSRGLTMVALSVATSIDALAVGLTLANGLRWLAGSSWSASASRFFFPRSSSTIPWQGCCSPQIVRGRRKTASPLKSLCKPGVFLYLLTFSR